MKKRFPVLCKIFAAALIVAVICILPGCAKTGKFDATEAYVTDSTGFRVKSPEYAKDAITVVDAMKWNFDDKGACTLTVYSHDTEGRLAETVFSGTYVFDGKREIEVNCANRVATVRQNGESKTYETAYDGKETKRTFVLTINEKKLYDNFGNKYSLLSDAKDFLA